MKNHQFTIYSESTRLTRDVLENDQVSYLVNESLFEYESDPLGLNIWVFNSSEWKKVKNAYVFNSGQWKEISSFHVY